MKVLGCLNDLIADIVYFFQFSCNSNVTISKVQTIIPMILDGVMTEEEIVGRVRDWFNLPEEDSLGIMTQAEFNRESLLVSNVRLALINLQDKHIVKMSLGEGSDGKIYPVYFKDHRTGGK